MDRKKIFLVILFVVLIAGIIIIFLSPKNTVNTPTKTASPAGGTTPTQIPTALCNPFPIIIGEISCQDAVNLAIAKYPGKITKIDRKILSIPGEEPPPPNHTSSLQKPPIIGQATTVNNPNPYQLPTSKLESVMAWQISITLDKDFSSPRGTVKILDAIVSLQEKKILVTYPKFQQ